MTRVDIFSGFLGAGKTTLIKKLIKEAYKGEKLVLIENEFGEIGIDGSFLKEAGIEIKEMNSGCICCSLQGDFKKSLKMVAQQYNPDRIIIEPTGVGALTTVVDAVLDADADLKVGGLTTVVDVTKCKKYLKNFGEFFNDQVETANVILLSRTKNTEADKIEDVKDLLEMKNPKATIITTDWDALDGKEILSVIEGRDMLKEELEKLVHEHMDECDDPECSCHDHDHHHEHEHDHEHHHEHDEHEHHHEHEHEHDYHHEHECDDPNCSCHDHDHEGHEHHHHHADDVFVSWGRQTAKRFTKEEIEKILKSFDNEDRFGMVLRAKGIVESEEGTWIHFDYTPGELDVRTGAAAVSGMLCVIGHDLNEHEVEEAFGVK